MKVNYQERIEEGTTELKIIMKRQETVTNCQKVQALYLLKSGKSQSITEGSELLGVHRITVQRWFKQYSNGGLRKCVLFWKNYQRKKWYRSQDGITFARPLTL